MLGKLGIEGILAFVADLVDVDDVIVGSSGKEVLTWGVSHDLAPFLCFLERADLLVEIIIISNGNLAHVSADSNVAVFL